MKTKGSSTKGYGKSMKPEMAKPPKQMPMRMAGKPMMKNKSGRKK